jgi:RNA polymerase sigma factor (sigma-70 family)
MANAARRNAVIAAHLGLVESIARNVVRSLPPCFTLDDLIGAGNVALTRCATRYKPGAHAGAPFSAFARQAIRGAMLDTVRRKNWTESTRPPLEDAAPAAAPHADPGDAVDAGRMTLRLAAAVSWLPPSQQAVLRACYGADEPTLREVAARFNYSTQTARTLRTAAIAGLQARFRIQPAA